MNEKITYDDPLTTFRVGIFTSQVFVAQSRSPGPHATTTADPRLRGPSGLRLDYSRRAERLMSLRQVT